MHNKIQRKSHGQHTDCTITSINEIENEKKIKLKENIKCLESLFLNLNESISKLKNICQKIEEEKEELKMKIQNIFTKLRNFLNDREDELLLNVDKKIMKYILKKI